MPGKKSDLPNIPVFPRDRAAPLPRVPPFVVYYTPLDETADGEMALPKSFGGGAAIHGAVCAYLGLFPRTRLLDFWRNGVRAAAAMILAGAYARARWGGERRRMLYPASPIVLAYLRRYMESWGLGRIGRWRGSTWYSVMLIAYTSIVEVMSYLGMTTDAMRKMRRKKGSYIIYFASRLWRFPGKEAFAVVVEGRDIEKFGPYGPAIAFGRFLQSVFGGMNSVFYRSYRNYRANTGALRALRAAGFMVMDITMYNERFLWVRYDPRYVREPGKFGDMLLRHVKVYRVSNPRPEDIRGGYVFPMALMDDRVLGSPFKMAIWQALWLILLTSSYEAREMFRPKRVLDVAMAIKKGVIEHPVLTPILAPVSEELLKKTARMWGTDNPWLVRLSGDRPGMKEFYALHPWLLRIGSPLAQTTTLFIDESTPIVSLDEYDRLRNIRYLYVYEDTKRWGEENYRRLEALREKWRERKRKKDERARDVPARAPSRQSETETESSP